ncbi:MAG TPA: Rrf2 family transcriptional regulator [Bacteroidia bacterium]|nr:Rrf2 family transcriptional regulator [Bacteroidia bacterium]
MFSKTCEYGIRATIYVALQSMDGHLPNLKDIAREIESPEAFTAKIMQLLVRANIVYSVKGASGGFGIEPRRMKKIKLEDIAVAVDGNFDRKICVLGLKACSEEFPCPVHNTYKHIKKDLQSMLQNTSLLDMSENIRNGKSYLKIDL